jgi:hypothetical protein
MPSALSCILPLLIAVGASAASVPVELQPGDVASVRCRRGDQLTIDSPTATTATLTCAAGSPFAGIDPTGTQDVTEQINAVLAALPNQTEAAFPPKARYRIEGTISVDKKDGIVLDGQGAVFFATTNGRGPASQRRKRAHWQVRLSHNVTLRNLVIVGASTSTGPSGRYDPALEAQHGLNIAGSTGVLVEHVDVSRTWGDCVYIGASGPVPSADVVVQDSRLVGASRMGLAITSGDRVTIQRNLIDQARRSLIDLETNSVNSRLSYIRILNNQLGVSRFSTVANEGYASDIHDLTIDGNRMISDRFRIGILAPPSRRRSNVSITNNVGLAVPHQNEPFAVLSNVDNAVVTGNVAVFSKRSWPARGGPFGSPQGAVMLMCSTGVAARNTWTKDAAIADLVERCP